MNLGVVAVLALLAAIAPKAEALDDYNIRGKVFQVLSNGILVSATIESRSFANPEKHTGIVFISDYPDAGKLFDGSPIKVRCSLAEPGTYQYTTVSGSKSTIQAFKFSSFPPSFED